jgi:predicted permease
MIAVAYKQDSELAASSVALSTVLSLLTMPPVIFLGSILLL